MFPSTVVAGRSVVVQGIDVTSPIVGEVAICISTSGVRVVWACSTRLPPTQSCEAVAS